jgi:hypothetical protein
VPTSNEPVAQEGYELLFNLHSFRFSLDISVYQCSLAVYYFKNRDRLRMNEWRSTLAVGCACLQARSTERFGTGYTR